METLIKMEDLKYKRNLGKFVASCNAPPSSVQVTVFRENESNVDAEAEARIVGRFIDVRVAEQREKLQLFQQEVRQRVRKQVNETQRVVGRHVRKVARREAHLVSQASQPRGMARKVAVSRVHQQPDVEDACLVAKKTSPQAARRRQWAKQQLLSKKVEETGTPILPGGQWRETEEMPSGSNSGSQEPFTHTRLKSHPTGDSTPLSSVLCDTTTSNTVLDSDASTVSLFPQGSYPNDTSNTSLRAPLISSVKRELQRKEERGQQYLTCRKVYAAAERDKVRTKRQQVELQCAAQRLKEAKEKERRMIEGVFSEDGSMSESLTSSQIAVEQEKLHRWQQQVAVHEQKRQAQRERETDRYLDALREQIKERMKARGIDPPPLCACHTNMWDSGPLTCANNCIFYRNPDTYARALASMLTSLDVL